MEFSIYLPVKTDPIMKKQFIILIALVATITAGAQSPINPGIKVGYTSSRISTNVGDIKDDIRSGFLAGAFLRVNLKKWYLQPEAYFATKGGELTYDMQDLDPNAPENSVTQEIKLQTVDIPVLLGYTLFDPPLMNVRIHGGPVASFLLNKDLNVTLNGVETEAEDFEETLKDANWGLQVGAGVDVAIFTLDVRYEFGLTNLYDKPEGETGDLNEYKSNVFLISLGWKIIP